MTVIPGHDLLGAYLPSFVFGIIFDNFPFPASPRLPTQERPRRIYVDAHNSRFPVTDSALDHTGVNEGRGRLGTGEFLLDHFTFTLPEEQKDKRTKEGRPCDHNKRNQKPRL